VGPFLEAQPFGDRLAAEPLTGRIQQQVEQLACWGCKFAIKPSGLVGVVR
jgi:hypothetical protein